VFEKLSVVVNYDQRECWIPASVVDIASAGARGRYLGWRYKTSVQPAVRWRRWGRNPHPEIDLEKAAVRSTAELVELAALLPIMAMEMRNVELRLCRGSREVVRLEISRRCCEYAGLTPEIACVSYCCGRGDHAHPAFYRRLLVVQECAP